jgi:hypothetical protein
VVGRELRFEPVTGLRRSGEQRSSPLARPGRQRGGRRNGRYRLGSQHGALPPLVGGVTSRALMSELSETSRNARWLSSQCLHCIAGGSARPHRTRGALGVLANGKIPAARSADGIAGSWVNSPSPTAISEIAARSPKPAQRLVPLPVLGLGCSSRHSIRNARAEVINREAATRPVTRAGSGGGLAGDEGGGPATVLTEPPGVKVISLAAA